MSKTFIVAGVVIVLVVGVIIVSKNNKDNLANSTESTNTEVTDSKAPAKKMAFSEFIKGMGSYQCTVSQSVEGNDTKGVVYLSKGLLRGEFNSTVKNFSINTNFIVRDGYTYTWTSMMPKIGFKTKINPTAMTANTAAQTQGSYNFNAEKIGDYDCQAWTVDQSKFTLPTGITFQELNK